tara:strand:- start:228379 stop:229431 length:1053 start_codon:yes stop_codon:yes gene_type:complete
MSGSRKKRSKLEMGHDSFLDIVANLVGILIILVVVLGTQSQQVMDQIQQELDLEESKLVQADESRATDQQMQTLASFAMRAASAQADSHRFENRIVQYDQQIELKRRQRAALLDLLSEANDAWNAEKERLDQQATLAASRSSRHEKLNVQLAKLQGESKRLSEQNAPVVAVEHLPTPMAKTVFGEEIHFRLKGNRVSYVPVKQLANEVGAVLQRAVKGSRTGVQGDTIGPIRGYIASLRIHKQQGLVNQGGRIGFGTTLQLEQIVMEPLSEPHGEPIEHIKSGQSVLDIELAGLDPATTTVTVWVYPDSFAAFRMMKEHLYAKGFATAGRPLKMDYPITASPRGSRSNAQ